MMKKTLGFGVGAMMGPALLTGAILYVAAPEAEAKAHELQMRGEEDGSLTQQTPEADGRMYKDYGVVWTKL